MILQIKFTQISNNANNNLFNIVSSALVFVALVTTMLTTFLIGYRIHSSSRSNGLPAKRLFAHIVTLVVESSAIYSILLLAYAILIEDPAASRLESRAADAEFYVQTILVVVSVCSSIIIASQSPVSHPFSGNGSHSSCRQNFPRRPQRGTANGHHSHIWIELWITASK